MSDIKDLIQKQAGLKLESMTGESPSTIRFNPRQGLQDFAQRIASRDVGEADVPTDTARPIATTTTLAFENSNLLTEAGVQPPVFPDSAGLGPVGTGKQLVVNDNGVLNLYTFNDTTFDGPV